MVIECPQCGETADKQTGAVNRARRSGYAVYCGRVCAADARRGDKTPEERKAHKAEYDAGYRNRNRDRILAGKKAHYEQNRESHLAAMAAKRAEIRADPERHAAYKAYQATFRTKEWQAHKRAYDRKYRAEALYGEFADAYLALQDLEGEIASRMSRQEAYQSKGTANKALQRRRRWQTTDSPL